MTKNNQIIQFKLNGKLGRTTAKLASVNHKTAENKRK